MKDMGEVKNYLGINIVYNREKHYDIRSGILY